MNYVASNRVAVLFNPRAEFVFSYDLEFSFIAISNHLHNTASSPKQSVCRGDCAEDCVSTFGDRHIVAGEDEPTNIDSPFSNVYCVFCFEMSFPTLVRNFDLQHAFFYAF